MIRMSTRYRYGLCAISELALRGAWVGTGTGPVSIVRIAKAQGIPVPYLRQILHALKRGRIVTAAMGKSGGYRMTCAPTGITAFDIAVALQERIVPVPCRRNATCCRHRPCGTRTLWQRVSALTIRELRRTTIDEMAGRPAAGRRTTRRRPGGSRED